MDDEVLSIEEHAAKGLAQGYLKKDADDKWVYTEKGILKSQLVAVVYMARQLAAIQQATIEHVDSVVNSAPPQPETLEEMAQRLGLAPPEDVPRAALYSGYL